MQEILSFLEKQNKYHTPDELRKCLEILGINFPPQKIILVTGTNGKGSTCATLQSLLIDAEKNERRSIGKQAIAECISETVLSEGKI